MTAYAFGQPVARLADIATRHAVDLESAEALALGTMLNDPTVDAATFLAFARWRAVGALLAACGNDTETFREVLAEAARLRGEGII